MFRSVEIDALQKVTNENFNDFGNNPREAFDIYTADLFGPGQFFTGFACVDAGTGQLNVSGGRIYMDGVGYVNDQAGGTAFDLLKKAPVSLSLWCAVVVYGQTIDSDTRPTTFLTDTATRATISRVEAQESLRFATIDIVAGPPSADPGYPLTPSNTVVVAYVLLTPTGISKIVANEEARAPSTVDHQAALLENAQWRRQTGTNIETLGSNLAALQDRIKDSPSGFLVRSMAQDLARVKEQLGLPSTYSSYSSDHYLDNSQSDINHPEYLCKVMEGIRFGDVAGLDKQLGLLNIYDPSVVTKSNMLYPAYDEVQGLNNYIGATAAVAINQYNFQDITYLILNGVRTRVRVGNYFATCSNWVWYYAKGGSYDALSGILKLSSGEVYQAAPEDAYLIGQAAAGVESHIPLRMRSVWLDSYADQVVTELNVTQGVSSGSIVGQTFLSTRDGYRAGFTIPLAQVGTTGDLHVMVTECDEAGAPLFTRVIARTTVPFAELTTNNIRNVEARFAQMPFLKKGQMYALVLQTVGNHYIFTTPENKYTQGSFFQCTDGRWAVASLDKDMAFVEVCAKFRQPRVEVQLQPLELQGGIAAIDILAQLVQPTGSRAVFMCQFNGEWRDITTLNNPATQPLNNLPLQLPFKVVFQGTQDIMPSVGVGPNSRVRTTRPRTDLKHISTPQAVGVPVKTIVLETRYENWTASKHTAAQKLRTGAAFDTIVSPTAVADAFALEDPKALIRTSTFVLGAAITTGFKIDTAGSTTSAVDTFHVADRTQVSTNP